ncbi:MAG: MCE family protein [Pirellulaceae bacterium]|nr:MCE family protein [Pirellulaceae bacterium]
MNDQGYKFGVGVLVVASMVIAVILILFFGAAPNIFSSHYDVTIRFDSAPGVTTDTPVRKSGVPVGRVKRIQLLEDGVNLTLELDGNYKIRAGEQPRIAKGSLITGDAVVEFIPPTAQSLVARFDGTAGSPADGLLDANERARADSILEHDGYYSGGVVTPDPMDALIEMQSSFTKTLDSIESAGNQVNALALDVRNIIGGGDGQFGRLAQKAELTIDNFNQTLASFNRLFNDPRVESTIDLIAERLPQLVTEAEGVMQQTSQTMRSFEEVGKAAGQTMQNVASFTEPFADKGSEFIEEARRSVNNLNGLVEELRQVSGRANTLLTRVNNGQGTLARLIEDDDLYYSMVNTLNNIEVVTRSLQPILQDARIFSDKVAREPSSLINLRGAITGQRGGLK